jgi:hypothetical protein
MQKYRNAVVVHCAQKQCPYEETESSLGSIYRNGEPPLGNTSHMWEVCHIWEDFP